MTNGDRVFGHITTFTPIPVTGLVGVLGGTATYIINHPIEFLERGLEGSY